jgi:hypothetical protein
LTGLTRLTGFFSANHVNPVTHVCFNPLVRFSFQPDITGLWVSLAAIAIAFSVLTLLIVSPKSEERKA